MGLDDTGSVVDLDRVWIAGAGMVGAVGVEVGVIVLGRFVGFDILRVGVASIVGGVLFVWLGGVLV